MVVCTHDLAQRKKLIVALLNSLGVEQTEDLTAEKVNGAKSRIPVTSEAVGIPQGKLPFHVNLVWNAIVKKHFPQYTLFLLNVNKSEVRIHVILT